MMASGKRRMVPLAGIAIAGAVACSGSRQSPLAHETNSAAAVDAVRIKRPEKICQKKCENSRGIQACLIEEMMDGCIENVRHYWEWNGNYSCASESELLEQSRARYKTSQWFDWERLPTASELRDFERLGFHAMEDSYRYDGPAYSGWSGFYMKFEQREPVSSNRKGYETHFYPIAVRDGDVVFTISEMGENSKEICSFGIFTAHQDGKITPDRSIIDYLGITEFKTEVVDSKYVVFDFYYKWGHAYHPLPY